MDQVKFSFFLSRIRDMADALFYSSPGLRFGFRMFGPEVEITATQYAQLQSEIRDRVENYNNLGFVEYEFMCFEVDGVNYVEFKEVEGA